ncbi:hypothetical protein [Methylacidimicrobium sp. B4]|uniref:hypothetical protein n=1 Tax=Methylacidimicrobium sp. B4 TaxID=2796139 RepID=UPI001A8F5BA0|nr:hypothetical protein [Methylacidimicrobium sp. B4]QSR84691.1 hypothetical protein MacB4_10960 [Methylacidimicrobium sp. B4]
MAEEMGSLEEILSALEERPELREAVRAKLMAEDGPQPSASPEGLLDGLRETNAILKSFLQESLRFQSSVRGAMQSLDEALQALSQQLDLIVGQGMMRWGRERIQNLVRRSGVRLAYPLEWQLLEEVIECAVQAGVLSRSEMDDLYEADFLGVGQELATGTPLCVAAAISCVVDRTVIERAASHADLWLKAARAAMERRPELLAKVLPTAPVDRRALAVGLWIGSVDADHADSLRVDFEKVIEDPLWHF